MDIPKMLPPEAYTGEMKDGVKQDAKNFMTDVKSYIEDAPAYQSDAAKIRFAINYFRGTFADEWKARWERGDITPGLDSTDATRMDFALFEEWFLTHTQDLGASIRHRREFFSYTGMGVPVDQVLQMAQMLQQRCNQHTESPQDHVTQSELWDKVSNLLDRETSKLCLVDLVTTTHPLHKNVPPYTVIEKHVKDILRLQQRLAGNSQAAQGFRHPAPLRLHNMEAGQSHVQLNNMQEHQPRDTGPTEGDDFLFNMVAGDTTSRQDVVDVTGVPCCSLEEADDLGHVACFNYQLHSLATSNYRRERSGEMRATAAARDMSRDMCNKCGKIGHWARNCPSQIAPGARQNYLQPQQAKRRPSNFRQPQRN